MYANAPHGESGRPPLICVYVICDNCLMMMDEVRPQASPLCASFDYSVDHESSVSLIRASPPLMCAYGSRVIGE